MTASCVLAARFVDVSIEAAIVYNATRRPGELALTWLFGVALLAAPARGFAQSTANGEVASAVTFPARGVYKNPKAVNQHYDDMADVTNLDVGISSGNPLALLLHPIVQLDLAASYNGVTPSRPPDSVVVISRVFRLLVAREQPASAAAQQPALRQSSAPLQTSVLPAPGGAGPMLTFVARHGADSTPAATWRTSATSIYTGSHELVRVDDTGIAFRGQRWLATVANFLDLRRQRNELPLTLIARGDTGRLTLTTLPARVQDVLRKGLRLTITEDVHRVVVPVQTLVELVSAPNSVKTRFGAIDFTIEGGDLDALRDFASRLAPVGPIAASTAMAQAVPVGRPDAPTMRPPDSATVSSRAAPPTPGKRSAELSASMPFCFDSLRVSDLLRAVVVTGIPNGSDSGKVIRLRVTDVTRSTGHGPVQVEVAIDSGAAAERGAPQGILSSPRARADSNAAPTCVPKGGMFLLLLSEGVPGNGS